MAWERVATQSTGSIPTGGPLERLPYPAMAGSTPQKQHFAGMDTLNRCQLDEAVPKLLRVTFVRLTAEVFNSAIRYDSCSPGNRQRNLRQTIVQNSHDSAEYAVSLRYSF